MIHDQLSTEILAWAEQTVRPPGGRTRKNLEMAGLFGRNPLCFLSG